MLRFVWDHVARLGRAAGPTASRWAALGLSLTLLGATAREAAAEEMRTVKVTPERVVVGAKLYGLCVPCHGSEGEDRAPRAARLTSKTFLEAASDRFIAQTINQGRAGTAMVGWGDVLSSEQIDSLVAFLRHKTPTEPATLDEAPLKGEAGNGAKFFMKSCVLCHNMSGSYREWGTGILRKPFLSQVSNGYLRYIIKNGKSGTSMLPFASGSPLPELNLNAQQIEDVIAFMRDSI